MKYVELGKLEHRSTYTKLCLSISNNKRTYILRRSVPSVVKDA